jgi:hypothetical protein
VWHVNDGPEGVVEPGDEHVARPVGAAGILVVERAGSL